jgi:hypothetical protein
LVRIGHWVRWRLPNGPNRESMVIDEVVQSE